MLINNITTNVVMLIWNLKHELLFNLFKWYLEYFHHFDMIWIKMLKINIFVRLSYPVQHNAVEDTQRMSTYWNRQKGWQTDKDSEKLSILSCSYLWVLDLPHSNLVSMYLFWAIILISILLFVGLSYIYWWCEDDSCWW